MELTVSSRQEGAHTVISVSGEIDVYTAPSLRERLNELVAAGHYDLIVDMEGVEFLDSTGLGVLVGGLKRVRSHDGTLRLVCAQEKILKVFRITGLTKVFPIHATLDEALVRSRGHARADRLTARTGRTGTAVAIGFAALPARAGARADRSAGRRGDRPAGRSGRGAAGRGAAGRRGGVCPGGAAQPARREWRAASRWRWTTAPSDLRSVEVTDHAGAVDLEEERIALALVRGLADVVTVLDGPGGPGGAGLPELGQLAV